MILSDEEIEAMFAKANDGYVGVMQNDVKFAKSIEAAILAKLASAELPEPATPNESGSTQCIVRWLVETPHGWIGSYEKEAISEICRQAYAQGAAAQLSDEPRLYAYMVNKVHNEYCEFAPPADAYDEGTLTPLYTRRQA